MFRRILVPLDGSAHAECALPIAARLTRALDGTLILARAVEPPLQLATVLPSAPQGEERILSESLGRATSYLAQIAQQPEQAGVKHEKVTLIGYPAEVILDTVYSSQADVIILCSHGRTGLLHWVLGSVAQNIVHQAPVPVLVLRQQGPLPPLDTQRPLRVLVPLDGSWLAEAALGSAATLVSVLAPQGQGALHLAQVLKHPPAESETASPPVGAREAALWAAQDYLSRTADHLQRGPFAQLQIHITWSVLVNQDVAGALVNLAQSVNSDTDRFDLIAMATHGRGGLHRWVMGSVTERVLAASRLPLLVIRPKEVIETSRITANVSITTAPPL